MPDLYTTIRAAVIDAAGISVNATRRPTAACRRSKVTSCPSGWASLKGPHGAQLLHCCRRRISPFGAGFSS